MVSLIPSHDLGLVNLRRRGRVGLGMAALAAVLAAALLCSLGIGAVGLEPGTILSILLAPLGIDLPWSFAPRDEAVLYAIRMPRTLLGLLVGAGLALAGAALQGLFRNPLADPALIGVSSGAAMAAVAVIVAGAPLMSLFGAGMASSVLPMAAFLGGLAATVIVYGVASRNGETDVPTMLLAGVAINAIAGAAIGMLIFLSDDQQLRDLSFWLLGSLGGVTWAKLLPAVPLLVLGLVTLPLFACHLNAFLLGESDAFHLGFNVERSKRTIVALAALLVGAGVALTGIIGFVGLVVPHVVRLLLGPDHRALLPASALLGGGLMLLADLAARTLVLPAELPIGALTSCIGGPFFLAMLLCRRGQGGLRC